jgi:hypothetical protein
MLRRRRAPVDPLAHVDPALVSARFAEVVADALEARRRYADVVAGVAEGPVRDRLVDAGARVDDGVAGVWEIAQRATQVERTLVALDPDRVADEYKRARRAGADAELEAVLGQRFASVQRLLNALDDTDARLRLLDARLGAAVAGAAEVALGVVAPDRLGDELDDVVTEIATLRGALDELG